MYQVTRKSIRMGGKKYEPGDKINIGDRTAKLLSDRVEEIDAIPFEPSTLTNSEIEEAVQDVDDVDLIEKLLDAEQSGDNRTGAIEALEERIDELTE